MLKPLLFKSQDFKTLLKITDCELMHLRESGRVSFKKRGNTYLYHLENKELLINHPISNQIINWHKDRHDVCVDNSPTEKASTDFILAMIEHILLPIENKFGRIKVTYGFVSAELNTHIQKNSSSGTCPSIDQHSSTELNKKHNHICERGGLACDFVVVGFEERMDIITTFIVNNLSFDKIYYYGNDRPLHVSINDQPKAHLQIMNTSSKGRRIPGRKAFGDDVKKLAETL